MKIACEIIRDLIPLYADDSLSDAGREAVEEHVRDCAACRAYLEETRAACKELDDGTPEQDFLAEASSLKRAGKAIRKKRAITILISAVAAAAALALCGYIGISVMKNTVIPVRDPDSVRVHYDFNGDLLADLEGQTVTHSRMVRVTLEGDTGKKTCLIFGAETTKWDEAVFSRRSAHSFFRLVLAYADKGADEIDRVYYLAPEEGDEEQFGQLSSLDSVSALEETEGIKLVFDRQGMTEESAPALDRSELTID